MSIDREIPESQRTAPLRSPAKFHRASRGLAPRSTSAIAPFGACDRQPTSGFATRRDREVFAVLHHHRGQMLATRRTNHLGVALVFVVDAWRSFRKRINSHTAAKAVFDPFGVIAYSALTAAFTPKAFGKILLSKIRKFVRRNTPNPPDGRIIAIIVFIELRCFCWRTKLV